MTLKGHRQKWYCLGFSPKPVTPQFQQFIGLAISPGFEIKDRDDHGQRTTKDICEDQRLGGLKKATKVKIYLNFVVFAFHGRGTKTDFKDLVCIQGLNLEALHCAQS